MDYAGGYSGEQNAQLASSIESLNGTISSLKDTVANFGSSLYRNMTNTAATAGSFGVGAFQNAYQAASPMMAPQVMEIMPGAFQRPPGGFLHNLMASAGVSGQVNTPWGFEMSPQAYQQRAQERVGKSLYGAYSGVMEGLSGSGNVTMAADIALGIGAAFVPGLQPYATAAIAGTFLEEKYTGGDPYSRHYEKYNRKLEGEALVQGMKLDGKDVSELDKSAYGAAYSQAMVEGTVELGKTSWFGMNVQRAKSSDMSAALRESGVEKQILGDDGKLEQDLGKFTERLKDKVRSAVELMEKLNIGEKEAWQMLAKINDTMGAEKGANQQDTVNKFFTQVQRGASAMDMAPMQAYDYMTKMQNIYQQTGSMSKQYWMDAGAYSMQVGGLGVKAGLGAEEALNAAGTGVVGATQMLRGGAIQDMFTKSIAQAGDIGRADLASTMAEIDRGISAGTLNVDTAKTLMSERLGKYMTPEALAAGSAYYNPSEVAKTVDVTRNYQSAQMFMNKNQDELYKGIDARQTFLLSSEAIKNQMNLDGRFTGLDESGRQSAWVAEVAKQTGQDVVLTGRQLSDAGLKELRRQNEEAAGMTALTNMGGGGSATVGKLAEWGIGADSHFIRNFSQDYVKNVIGGTKDYSVSDTQMKTLLAGGDISAQLTSAQRSVKEREAANSEDLSGIYNLPTDVKMMVAKGMKLSNTEGVVNDNAFDKVMNGAAGIGSDSMRSLMAEVAASGGLEGKTKDEIRESIATLAGSRNKDLDVNSVYNNLKGIGDDSMQRMMDPYTSTDGDKNIATFKSVKSRFMEIGASSPDLLSATAKNFGVSLEGADTAEERASRIAAQVTGGGLDANRYNDLWDGIRRDNLARIVANPMMQGGQAPVNYQGSDAGVGIVGAITNRQYDRVAGLLDSDQSKDSVTMSLADISAKSNVMSSQSSAAATMMRMYQSMDGVGDASGDTEAVKAALASEDSFKGLLKAQGVGESERDRLGGIYRDLGIDKDKAVTTDEVRSLLTQSLGALASGNQIMSPADLETGAANVAAQKQAAAADAITTAFGQLNSAMQSIITLAKTKGD